MTVIESNRSQLPARELELVSLTPATTTITIHSPTKSHNNNNALPSRLFWLESWIVVFVVPPSLQSCRSAVHKTARAVPRDGSDEEV